MKHKVIVVLDCELTDGDWTIRDVQDNAVYLFDHRLCKSFGAYTLSNPTVYVDIKDFDLDRDERLDHFDSVAYPFKSADGSTCCLRCNLHPDQCVCRPAERGRALLKSRGLTHRLTTESATDVILETWVGHSGVVILQDYGLDGWGLFLQAAPKSVQISDTEDALDRWIEGGTS